MSIVMRTLMHLSVPIVCGSLLTFGLAACKETTASNLMQTKLHSIQAISSIRHSDENTPDANTSGTMPEATPTAKMPGYSDEATPDPSAATPGSSSDPSAATPDAASDSSSDPSVATPNAASDSSAATPNATANATPNATANATPNTILLPTPEVTPAGPGTPSRATPTGTKTTPQLQQFKGDSFSISTPKDWNEKKSDNQVVFTNSDKTTGLAIMANKNPDGTTSATNALDAEAKQIQSHLTNVQKVPTDSTVSQGGATWNQQTFKGDTKWGNMTYTVLTTVHPTSGSNSKVYQIVYYAPTKDFDQAKTTYFQPMLKSFAFTG